MILAYAKIISNRTDGTFYEWHILEAEIDEHHNVKFINNKEIEKLAIWDKVIWHDKFRENLCLVKGKSALEKKLDNIDTTNFDVKIKKHDFDIFEIRTTVNKKYEQELKNLLQKVQK